tara:strand:- start:49 stop:417 length:369 start_codon:yes stop_codon:yes gene_type:complete
MTYTIYQIFNSLGNLKRPHGFISIEANWSRITEEDIINASKDTKEDRLLGTDPYELIDDLRKTADWFTVREERNKLLESTDWITGRDVPEETKNKWEKYRKELRDITKQPDPKNIIWPSKPK